MARAEHLARATLAETLTIATDAYLSSAIFMGDFAILLVHMPDAWTAASIGFHVAVTKTGTYIPLYDDNGTLIQIDSPTVDQAYSAPVGVAGAVWVKLWSQDGSGSNTNQGAARSIEVVVKS